MGKPILATYSIGHCQILMSSLATSIALVFFTPLFCLSHQDGVSNDDG
jgi:hypothetical protein